MRTVIQRVKEASVTIDGKIHGQIGYGYMILVGFTHTDTVEIIREMARKIVELRICEDENQKMNLSLKDINGEILSISQFTLYADARKGRRPSFIDAMSADKASQMYDIFNDELRKHDVKVETGIFQADMKVALINDGPVTIILDSREVLKNG